MRGILSELDFVDRFVPLEVVIMLAARRAELRSGSRKICEARTCARSPNVTGTCERLKGASFDLSGNPVTSCKKGSQTPLSALAENTNKHQLQRRQNTT